MTSADVAVIGGGCNGASAAFHLARRGTGKVVLVEKGRIAGGPTGRSSGIVRMHYSLEPLIRLAVRSLEIFQRFGDAVGGTADFKATGFLLLAGPADMPNVEANVRLQASLGVRTSVLNRQQVAALDPRLNLEDIGGGAYEPDSGYADGYATASVFAAAARRLGVEVLEDTPAIRILVERGTVRGVETAKGVIHSPRVLVAAGPWTPSLLDPLGVTLPIQTTRHQVARVALPAEFGTIGRVCVDLVRGFYVRPDVGMQVLFGSIGEPREEIVPTDAFNQGMDFEFAERMARHFSWRYPGGREARVLGGYASLYDLTPDWQPVLGPVEEVAGLYVAAGFSGHGFKLSPAMGEVMAGFIAGEPGRIDVSAFRPSRFREGALIRVPYAYGILG